MLTLEKLAELHIKFGEAARKPVCEFALGEHFFAFNTQPAIMGVIQTEIQQRRAGLAIGDHEAVVGGRVTFWGSQWARDNPLSGGSAPSSFKGFASQSSPMPPRCGGTWSAALTSPTFPEGTRCTLRAPRRRHPACGQPRPTR